MSHSVKNSPFAFYAFYQLYSYFYDDCVTLTFDSIRTQLFPTYTIKNEDEESKVSLFITWKKKDLSGIYQLRGCIGTFSKLPLLEGIKKYSLISAFQDSRFNPIDKIEIPLLSCTCSILLNFKTIFYEHKGNIFEWEIGVNGIELTFREPRTGTIHNSTFLPDVMVEYDMTKEETFRSLIQKAGCHDSINEIMKYYDKYFVQVVIYECNKSEITYDEFNQLINR